MEIEPVTSQNEQEIRELIQNWTRAISIEDRSRILAHHSRDLLMFNLQSPIVRGIIAYDKCWDLFFRNTKGKVRFVTRNLEITAGNDVAFASCLVHCEGISAQGPVELRLSMGLRKVSGAWNIVHEHHSLPAE